MCAEIFKKGLDTVLRDMVSGEILVVSGQLDWIILGVFSNLGDSVINTAYLKTYINPSYRAYFVFILLNEV